MGKKFSKRHGYQAPEAPISIRNEAPLDLREAVIQMIYDESYQPSFVRRHLCKLLRKRPDQSNWSEFPNIDSEVQILMEECQWYQVYDFIEAIWDEMDTPQKESFQEEINDYFIEKGIGWKFHYGQIEYRGQEGFEQSMVQAVTVLADSSLSTASQEIREAIHDLSRRPEPDITGAIQHALASLECTSRELAGDSKATLGELIKKYPGIIPKPLDGAIEKLWGFSSEQGRHLKEGKNPTYEEAELTVGICAAIVTYLGKKLLVDRSEKEDDLPF